MAVSKNISKKRIVVLLIIAASVWVVALMILFGFNPLDIFSFSTNKAEKISKGVVIEDIALSNAKKIAKSKPLEIQEFGSFDLKGDYFSPIKVSQEDIEQLAKIITEQQSAKGLKFAGLVKEKNGSFMVFLKTGKSIESYKVNEKVGNLGILYFANSMGALVINPKTGQFYTIK